MALSRKQADKDRPVVEKMEDRTAPSEAVLEETIGDSPEKARERERFLHRLGKLHNDIIELGEDARLASHPDIASLVKEFTRAINGSGFEHVGGRDNKSPHSEDVKDDGDAKDS